MVDETSNWCTNTHSIHGKLNYNPLINSLEWSVKLIIFKFKFLQQRTQFSLNFFASCTERKLPNLFYITSCYPKEGTKNKTKQTAKCTTGIYAFFESDLKYLIFFFLFTWRKKGFTIIWVGICFVSNHKQSQPINRKLLTGTTRATEIPGLGPIVSLDPPTKLSKPINVSMPLPNGGGGEGGRLHLLAWLPQDAKSSSHSIRSDCVWKDITESTPLSIVRDVATFSTTDFTR